ncbi:hypothetical protein BD414DRAFT_578750 [Trametes punicea]|nr:hypothetical protein BD414DRAFT_578750 [Trametes punicea]
MSSSNINDPSAIQALLDRLRSSEAWQRAVAANAAASPSSESPAGAPATHTSPREAERLSRAGNSTGTSLAEPHAPYGIPTTEGSVVSAASTPSNPQSVASLLSQLQASSHFAAVAGTKRTPESLQLAHAPAPAGTPEFLGPEVALPSSTASTHTTTVAAASRTPPPRQDLRACTFQQALPHLARLSEDERFLKTLAAMRAEQAELERQLWKERREIQRKHEERVKAARTRASIIGAGLTQYEADSLTDSFRSELAGFDRERVLAAWDGLLTKQQAALESLRVPAMFPTTMKADRERQQEIMQVLDRIVKNEGSHPTRAPGRDG